MVEVSSFHVSRLGTVLPDQLPLEGGRAGGDELSGGQGGHFDYPRGAPFFPGAKSPPAGMSRKPRAVGAVSTQRRVTQIAVPTAIIPTSVDEGPLLTQIAVSYGLPADLDFRQVLGAGLTANDRLEILYFLRQLQGYSNDYRQSEEQRRKTEAEGSKWQPDSFRKLLDRYQTDVFRVLDEQGLPMYQNTMERLLVGRRKLGRMQYFPTLANYVLEQDRRAEYDLAKYEPELVFLAEPCPRCRQKKLWGGASIVTRGDEAGRARITCQACSYTRVE